MSTCGCLLNFNLDKSVQHSYQFTEISYKTYISRAHRCCPFDLCGIEGYLTAY